MITSSLLNSTPRTVHGHVSAQLERQVEQLVGDDHHQRGNGRQVEQAEEEEVQCQLHGSSADHLLSSQTDQKLVNETVGEDRQHRAEDDRLLELISSKEKIRKRIHKKSLNFHPSSVKFNAEEGRVEGKHH